MSSNWIDKMAKKKQGREETERISVARIQKNIKRLSDSDIAEKIKTLCYEANRKAELKMKYSVETDDNGVKRILVMKEPPTWLNYYFDIRALEKGIVLRFDAFLGEAFRAQRSEKGLDNWAEYIGKFSCSGEIDPTKISDDDIDSCFQYLHNCEGPKPKIIYQPTKSDKKKDSCFIATVVYGSEGAREVTEFKLYRDKVLLSLGLGRKLVKVYYWFSPEIANKLEKYSLLRYLIRKLILCPIFHFIRFYMKRGYQYRF